MMETSKSVNMFTDIGNDGYRHTGSKTFGTENRSPFVYLSFNQDVIRVLICYSASVTSGRTADPPQADYGRGEP